MNEDQKHLQLLSIFHYVVGGITMLFSSMFVVHFVIGLMMLIAPEKFAENGETPPAFVGYLFAGMGGVAVLCGYVFAGCFIYSGRMISRRKKHMFSFVTACVGCVSVPFGTILGVFTILVLSRVSVKKLYGIGK